MKHEGWWFRLHRGIQCTGLLAALIGFGCIIAALDELKVEHFTKPHHQLGLVIMIGGVMQPINAVLRPHKGDQRLLWQIIHKGSGYLLLLGGIYNCIVGLGLDQVAAKPEFKSRTDVFFWVSFGSVAFTALALHGAGHLISRMDISSDSRDSITGEEMLAKQKSDGVLTKRESVDPNNITRFRGNQGMLPLDRFLKEHPRVGAFVEGLPTFVDFTLNNVRSRTFVVFLVLYIFVQAMTLVAEQMVSSSTANSSYEMGHHVLLLTLACLPIFLGNSTDHSHMWSMMSLLVIPISIAATILVSGYVNIDFGGFALTQFVVIGGVVILLAIRILIKYSDPNVVNRRTKNMLKRRQRYVGRLLTSLASRLRQDLLKRQKNGSFNGSFNRSSTKGLELKRASTAEDLDGLSTTVDEIDLDDNDGGKAVSSKDTPLPAGGYIIRELDMASMRLILFCTPAH
jgi:hypothetical protein